MLQKREFISQQKKIHKIRNGGLEVLPTKNITEKWLKS
jgi:hypothetical protein